MVPEPSGATTNHPLLITNSRDVAAFGEGAGWAEVTAGDHVADADLGVGGKNKYGHLISRPAGFIDTMLEQEKNVDEIVAEWSRQHPDKKPITPRRVVAEIKHLLAEHNVKVEAEKGQAAKPKKAQG